MWPVIGGLISGLGSFFGAEQTNQQSAQNTMMTNSANVAMQSEAERYNTAMVNQQESYAADMSNTAYRRATTDMQAAGLNPAMMFGSGSAASSPSGTAASVSPVRMERPQYQSPLSGLGDVVNHVVSNAVQMKSIDKMADEIANLQTTRAKIVADTGVSKAEEENLRARTGTQYQETGLKRAASEVMQNAAKTAANEMDINPTLRKWLDQFGYGGGKGAEALLPLTSIVNSASKVRGMIPSRSTSEWTNSSGGSSFVDRWSGMYN